jgi:hypothetical protein
MPVTTTGVKLRKSHFSYGGTDYFRRDAETVRLVSWGEKRKPLGGINYLSVQQHIPAAKFKVIKATKVKIDLDQKGASDLTADVKPAQLEFAGGSVQATRELASKGQLRLVMFHVLPEELMDRINGNPALLETLKDAPNDMRVAHRIWVVMKAQLADSVDTSTEGSATGTIEGITVKLNGGHNGQSDTKLTVSPKSTFAYALGELRWDEKRKNKRTKVVGIRLDDWGGGA